MQKAKRETDGYTTLDETNVLDTPLLPGFNCKVGELFTSVVR